jgi:hypothetical protein
MKTGAAHFMDCAAAEGDKTLIHIDDEPFRPSIQPVYHVYKISAIKTLANLPPSYLLRVREAVGLNLDYVPNDVHHYTCRY